jgi:hypothetical protein
MHYLSHLSWFQKTLFILTFILFVLILVSMLFIRSTPKNNDSQSTQEAKKTDSYPEGLYSKLSTPEQSGTLTITSSLEAVTVIIDPPQEEVTSEVAEKNITPFKITTIPAGKHIIEAFKDGYVPFSEVITVETGKTTEFTINLIPIGNDVKY